MRGRPIWAAKSVATSVRPLSLEKKYGILEINPKIFSGLSEEQMSRVAILKSLRLARLSQKTEVTSDRMMFLTSVNSSIRAEDLPVTRNFLFKKIRAVFKDGVKAEAALQIYEKYFGKDYANAVVSDTVKKWRKVYKALSGWQTKKTALHINIYHFAMTYMRVYPEKVAWFREPDFKTDLEQTVVALYQYSQNFRYVPTFMRVTPTPYRNTLMPFSDVEDPRERISNYFRFKKQVRETLEVLDLPSDETLSTAGLVQYIELIARVHQAMIYYHFWEQLNGRMTRAFMSLMNKQFGLLPIILNMDAVSIDQYKYSNQIQLITQRDKKLQYDAETYQQFASATIDWILTQQIKAEQFYAELRTIR